MATAQVFNGNIDSALLVLKKQLQRDQIVSRVKARTYFLSKRLKTKMKKRESSKRHARRKSMQLRKASLLGGNGSSNVS